MTGDINPTLHTAALAAVEGAINRALELAPAASNGLSALAGEVFALHCTAPQVDIFLQPTTGGAIRLIGIYDGPVTTSVRGQASDFAELATATDPWRRLPAAAGGVQRLPSSGADTVLQPAEIARLIGFARELPNTFPPITDDQGRPAPADVEFGFVGGELQLFQLRPFLESKTARGIGYLHEMEARHRDTSALEVDMNGVPSR